jgi:hypothetical protein
MANSAPDSRYFIFCSPRLGASSFNHLSSSGPYRYGLCELILDHHKPDCDHRPIPGHQQLRWQSVADAARIPYYPAPVVRNLGAERELTMMRWGMPPSPKFGGPPVTKIRNTASPHWRGWPKPESRRLVPVNSFADMRRNQIRRPRKRMSSGSR